MLVDGAAAESFADALIGAGALSVAIEDAAADQADEQPLYGEPGLEPEHHAWHRNRLTALLDRQTDAVGLIQTAADQVGIAAPAIRERRTVIDEDWVRRTRSQFAPVQIAERLWIVPTWCDPPDPTAINIRLDPGVAFGTGTHPTTRLCLEWLAQADLAGRHILDYGCGSGILSIAAAKLGASAVSGTDIDPQAVAAARANTALNAVTARYTEPHHLARGEFDIVMANILTNALIVLAPTLLTRLADGGRLVLSGILARQAQDIIDAYCALDHRLSLNVWQHREDWVCIVGERSR